MSAGDITASKGLWPDLQGCIVIVFASRAGSTFLCRHAESQFNISGVGESLNTAILETIQARRDKTNTLDTLKETIGEQAQGGWFLCKAGTPGLISGELHGFFDQYLNQTTFIFLLRRDLAQQAISLFKARLTKQFHSNQNAERAATVEDFNRGEISRYLKTIYQGCLQIKAHLDITGRPYYPVFYEDFENGDMTGVENILSTIGLPRRIEPLQHEKRQVNMLDRTVNAAWRERYAEEMEEPVRGILERYEHFLDSI